MLDVEPTLFRRLVPIRLSGLSTARPGAAWSRAISLSCDCHKCQVKRTQVTAHHPRACSRTHCISCLLKALKQIAPDVVDLDSVLHFP